MDLLQGITIIDFTRLLPGPLATHLLAQMGATVIKIESPQRMDYARASGAQVDGASVLFHQLNHNKQSRIIDYNTEVGKAEIMGLIQNADALIEQFRPGAMDAWGFGYDTLKTINPSLVYASLTGYGQDNPYANEAGHDFNYLAYAGIMGLLKDPANKPTVSDTQFADIAGSYMAVMALQAALLKKAQTGKGCYLDIPIADAMTPFLAVPYALYKGGMDYRKYNIINGKTTVNYAAYQCADGKWLSVAAMELKFWNRLCELIGQPTWQRNNQMELFLSVFPKEQVVAHFKTKSRDEWMQILHGEDVCVAPILEIEELENSDYHQQKNTFTDSKTPNGTILSTINLPFRTKQ